MSFFGRCLSRNARGKKMSYPALACALMLIALAGQDAQGQTASPPFNFRAGQAMYIVAFHIMPSTGTVNPVDMSVTVGPSEYIN